MSKKRILDQFFLREIDLCTESGAKDEIFCEFDSMLASFLTDSAVDITFGIPQLQIVNLFENFIKKVVKERKFRFRVIYFEEFGNMWDDTVKCIRTIILTHLERFVDFDKFESPNTIEFSKYLVSSNPVLVLGSNGDPDKIPFICEPNGWDCVDFFMVKILKESGADFVLFSSLKILSNSFRGSRVNMKKSRKAYVEYPNFPVQIEDVKGDVVAAESFFQKYEKDANFLEAFVDALLKTSKMSDDLKKIVHDTMISQHILLSLGKRMLDLGAAEPRVEVKKCVGEIYANVNMLLKDEKFLEVALGSKSNMKVLLDVIDPRLCFVFWKLNLDLEMIKSTSLSHDEENRAVEPPKKEHEVEVEEETESESELEDWEIESEKEEIALNEKEKPKVQDPDSLLKLNHEIIKILGVTYQGKRVLTKEQVEEIDIKNKEFKDNYHWKTDEKFDSVNVKRIRKRKYKNQESELDFIQKCAAKEETKISFTRPDETAKESESTKKAKSEIRNKIILKELCDLKDLCIEFPNNDEDKEESVMKVLKILIQMYTRDIRVVKIIIELNKELVRILVRRLKNFHEVSHESQKCKWNLYHRMTNLKLLMEKKHATNRHDWKIRNEIKNITNLVKRKEMGKRFVDLVRFCENEMNKEEIAEFKMIRYQLHNREKYENIEQCKELETLADYSNIEKFNKYKKKFGFVPDLWQERLMQNIDDDKSVIVCTPTSSGKTFLSMYAIGKVLKQKDFCAYVAPTNALVSQVATDVWKHFHDKPKDVEVLGIFTSDQRKAPYNCHVLVTNVECLQILFLTKSEDARKWREKLKYIIFDEVHCMNDFGTGSTLERLFLIAPCPFLALSATIGNSMQFFHWLKFNHPSKQVELIENDLRPNDLKFYHIDFEEENERKKLIELHPFSFVNGNADEARKKTEIDNFKKMTSSQCLKLVKLVKEIFNENIPKKFFKRNRFILDPEVYFVDYKDFCLIPRNQIQSFEKDIRELLKCLCVFPEKYDMLIEMCGGGLSCIPEHCKPSFRKLEAEKEENVKKEEKEEEGEEEKNEEKEDQKEEEEKDDEKDMLYEIFKLLEKLDMLPALVFHFDKRRCTFLGKQLLASMKKDGREKIPDGEIDEIVETIAKKDDGLVGEELLECLAYGIGVHHGNMGKHYKDAVEYLFRRGKLKMCIATGTLSYGINAPCRTVVIFEDSPFLTPTLYNQTTGRSGRRGFDTIGNVVVFEIPKQRLRRLHLSGNEHLTGQMCITPTFVLRLMISINSDDHSTKKFIRETIKRLICVPLARMGLGKNGGAPEKGIVNEEKHKARYYFRFCLEFLMDIGLIKQDGVPIDFSGLASHLFYTEPSNFLFIRFLKCKLFHSLDVDNKKEKLMGKANKEEWKEIKKKMWHVLCILFTDFTQRKEELFLPKLPEGMENFRTETNNFVRILQGTFRRFLKNYENVGGAVSGKSEKERCTLPISQICYGESDRKLPNECLKYVMKEMKLCSYFAGLSGNSDSKILNGEYSIPKILKCLEFSIDQKLFPIPFVLLEEKWKLSCLYYDYVVKHMDLEQIRKKYRMEKNIIRWKLNGFRKKIRVIMTSVTRMAFDLQKRGKTDWVVVILQEMCKDFQKRFFSWSTKKWKRKWKPRKVRDRYAKKKLPKQEFMRKNTKREED